MPDILVQTPQPRQFLLVLHFFSAKVDILQIIELCNVCWNVLDPDRSRSDTPLVHQEQQRLRWCVSKPELVSHHSANRLCHFPTSLVQTLHVPSAKWSQLT